MSSVDLLPSMIKIFSALAIVIGIMMISLYAAKKIMRRTEMRVDGGEVIKVLSTRYVGPKSSIMLVDVLGKVLVVGLCQQNLSLLTSIDDQQSLERLKPHHVMGQKPSPFSEQLAIYKDRLMSAWRVGEKSGSEHA